VCNGGSVATGALQSSQLCWVARSLGLARSLVKYVNSIGKYYILYIEIKYSSKIP
jgi:hypothetical protein